MWIFLLLAVIGVAMIASSVSKMNVAMYGVGGLLALFGLLGACTAAVLDPGDCDPNDYYDGVVCEE